MFRRIAMRVHAPSNSLFSFIFKHIHHSKNLQLDTLMLLLNREGSFRTESVPDGKLPAGNHRQFRCYCPLAPARVSVKQESIPWQSFVFDAVRSSTIRNTSLGPPQKGGLGDDDFQFLGPFAGRKCVCAHAIIQLNICNGFFDLPCYFLTSSFCPRC